MIEKRVAHLEEGVTEIKRDLASIRETLARIDGRVSAMPTAFQVYMALLVTWGAGGAIAFAAVRLAGT